MCDGNPVTASDLVQLDPDHPGFRDAAYRARRNAIARVAMEFREGDAVPAVEYTEDEQSVWRTVWQHLDGLHAKYACQADRGGGSGGRPARAPPPQPPGGEE